MIDITVDGILYRYWYDDRTGVITLEQIGDKAEYTKVASAQLDDGAEQVYYSYFTKEDGKLTDYDGSSSDLYYNHTPQDIATWLAATHPVNG